MYREFSQDLGEVRPRLLWIRVEGCAGAVRPVGEEGRHRTRGGVAVEETARERPLCQEDCRYPVPVT